MKAVVLGASGHLGAHLVRALLSRGDSVRAFVRPNSATSAIDGLPIEVVRGDVLDRESVRRSLRDRETVYHLAAPTTLVPGVRHTIVEGTRIVLEEAKQAAVPRVLLVSSVVTIGYSDRPDRILDESSAELSRASDYHVAKWEAEQMALALARAGEVPVSVVNPASIVGPLDYRVTPSNAPIQRCIDGGLPLAFAGGLTITHAADVAEGVFLAASRGQVGERYILGGECVSIPEYFASITRACGRAPPRLVVPRLGMLSAGLAANVLRALGVRGMPFTFGQIRNVAGRYAWYSSEKARLTLGFRWRSSQSAIASYVNWVRDGRPLPEQ